MVFSSPIFLFIFLPICMFVYLLTNIFGNVKVENICLLIFSIIFYSYGSFWFLPILIISIIVNYILSLITYNIDNDYIRVPIFIFSILINVALLFTYKYLNLFTEFLYGSEGATHIVLPIGISFYTFQVLSYLADVYRRDAKPCRDIIDFALFTMLFPQLIAGPIVRYGSIDEALRYRKTNFDDFANGIKRFMIGFAKKILFANALGRIADLAFSELGYYDLGPRLSIFVLICYSMQIYLDFWAYSDMAIGIGKIFGFNFPENFNMPFLSTSITEFWNRWHMTLSNFFRDYVYIPLGGNRYGKIITCINLFMVFTLSGFWHGASFNFLLWGMYNAFFLIIERLFLYKIKDKVPSTIGIIYVFLVWTFGMILFRFDNMADIKVFIEGLMKPQYFNYSARELIDEIFNPAFIASFIVSVLYLTPFFDKINDTLCRIKFGIIIVDIVVIALFLYAVVEMLTTGFNPFIYFRF